MFQALKPSCCFLCSSSQEFNCCNLCVEASKTIDAVCVEALEDPIVATDVQALKNSIVAVCAQALKILQGCKFGACLDNSMIVYWTWIRRTCVFVLAASRMVLPLPVLSMDFSRMPVVTASCSPRSVPSTFWIAAYAELEATAPVRIMAPARVIAVVNMKLRFDGLRTSSSLWFNFPVPPPQGHKKVPDSEEKQTSSHRHLVAERFNSSHWSFEETWRQGKLSSYKLYF